MMRYAKQEYKDTSHTDYYKVHSDGTYDMYTNGWRHFDEQFQWGESNEWMGFIVTELTRDDFFLEMV